jgi:hypothetical protein
VLGFLAKHIVDAYIILLLGLQASMIFPALNWLPHPIRWVSSVPRTDKFAFIVAIFTAVLALATWVQVWAYTQSERAYLIAEDLKFVHGVPSTAEGGLTLDLTVRNVGRHIATITGGNVSPLIHVQGGKLPSIPQYLPNAITVTIPPLPPENIFNFPFIVEKFTPLTGVVESPKLDAVVVGIVSGQMPIQVYGFIDYNTGYNLWGTGRIGFCFNYIHPSSLAPAGQFITCDNPKYTYNILTMSPVEPHRASRLAPLPSPCAATRPPLDQRISSLCVDSAHRKHTDATF